MGGAVMGTGTARSSQRLGGSISPWLVLAPWAPFEDGYRAAEICDAILRSAQSGRREIVSYRGRRRGVS